MTAVIQRVRNCVLTADGREYSKIGQGLLILLGVRVSDTEADAEKLARKICELRIFSDEQGKMNLSAADIGGSLMIVSNFTLCANAAHGRRPSFSDAARPEAAEPLYEKFVACCETVLPVQTGVFGADMQISLVNDGPITLVLRSEEL